MSHEHENEELKGLRDSAAAQKVEADRVQWDNAELALKSARGRAALAAALSAIGLDEARLLADTLSEAMTGHRMDYLRTITALEELGVKFPAGIS